MIIDDTIGLVCARAGSKRLPDKNKLPIGNTNLTNFALSKLVNLGLRDVYLLTNMAGFEGKHVIKRPEFLNGDDVPLQNVALWFLHRWRMDLPSYTHGLLLIPTNPLIMVEDLERAQNLLADNSKFNILRSYDIDGNENGMYWFDIKYVLSNTLQYDTYTRSIVFPGKEIHTNDEYLYFKKIVEERHVFDEKVDYSRNWS